MQQQQQQQEQQAPGSAAAHVPPDITPSVLPVPPVPGLLHAAAAEAPAGGVRRFIEVFGTSSLSAYVFHEILLYYRIGGVCFETLWGRSCGWGTYTLLTGVLIGLTWGLCQGLDRLEPGLRWCAAVVAERLRQGLGDRFARSR